MSWKIPIIAIALREEQFVPESIDYRIRFKFCSASQVKNETHLMFKFS